ncbi:MAG TPA: ABC transporter substrate-binding protein, partial [Mycobacteriales bacterium]|nr:ABC transporter substrate-binding protein [Mycobacteriales bacterium]
VQGPAPAAALGQPTAGGPVVVPGQAATGGGSAAGPGAVTGPGAVGAGGQPGSPGSTGVVVGEDRSRCAGAKQFTDFPEAPPCVPHTGNPGATYPGVTAKTIKLVYFREKDNPVVRGLLSSQNLYSDPEDQRRFMAAMETFINKRYELYGRKVQIAFWQSPCEAAPPVDSCFRDDAKALVAQEKPFAVVYDNNTNTPAFFDELSKLGVVNFGGWHFQDSFNTAHRPYHYDVPMGGDTQAVITGEYWCKKLAGKKARYAGSADLQAKVRKAAVFFPQTSVNTEPAQHLARIMRGCGTEVTEIPYSPDTATASSQATSQVAQAKNSGATTVLYFSDPIAPAFGTKAMTTQSWFPEHVLVGSGLLDYDVLARLYDPQQWVHAFGPSNVVVYRPLSQQESAITWRAAGNTGTPYTSAQLPWGYWAAVAAGIQMAGPSLTPLTFEAALLSGRVDTLPWTTARDPHTSWTHFGSGDYTAGSDQKQCYWDPNATSTIDGKTGAYVALDGGRRYRPGEWTAGEPVLPGR